MVTTETVATLETVSRRLAVLGDALLGNASLAADCVTEPETFLALHEHAVEIKNMVEALNVARLAGA